MRVISSRRRTVRFRHRPRFHLHEGKAAEADGAIERPLHIMCGNRCAVPEFCLRVDFERQRLSIFRDGPGLNDFRFDFRGIMGKRSVTRF